MTWTLNYSYPLWVIILITLIVTGWSLFIYRKENLPKPWCYILPALRALVVLLLCGTLLQPVIAIVTQHQERGIIPVVIDTSGSMSVKDQYLDEQKVKIAWHLKLFDPQLRNTTFKELLQKWPMIVRPAEDLTKMIQRADALEQKGLEGNLKTFANHMQSLKNILEEQSASIQKSVQDCDYIDLNKKDKRQLEFEQLYKQCLAQLNEATKTFDIWLKKMEQSSGQSVGGLKKIFKSNQLKEQIVSIQQMEVFFLKLQDQADQLLAHSKKTEIEKAIEKISEMKRIDTIKYLLDKDQSNVLKKLEQIGDVELFSFREDINALGEEHFSKMDSKLANTRMGSVIRDILKHYENRPVSSLLVFSDGNNNAGTPIVEAKQIALDRGIPIYTLGVGSEKPPADVAIEKVIAPRSSFVDDTLNINMVMRRKGFLNKKIKVKVMSEDKILHEQIVAPGKKEKVLVNCSFIEKRSGRQRYTIEAEYLDGDILKENNRSNTSVLILKDRIRTLLIDEFPRWETRYATMMLSRDRRIDLKPLFVASMEKGKLKKGKDGFPIRKEELFAYHILIIGDVNPRHFSPLQLQNIKDFVIERGGTVLFLAGQHYMPSRYTGTSIEEILPFIHAGKVEHLKGKNNRNKKHQLYRLNLSENASLDDVVQLGGTPKDSEWLWQSLPKLNWVKEGVETSVAAETLVQTEEDEIPLLVKSEVGSGKTLYIGSDSFWRWRYRARWKYHHRFWGQILLWATQGRTSGSNRYVKLMTERASYAPEETVKIKARILDEQKHPIDNASASVDVFDGDNKLIGHVKLHPVEDSGGEYVAELRDLKRGKYSLTPMVDELEGKDIKSDVRFEVKDLPTSEYVDIQLNEQQLKMVSKEYRPFYKVDEIISKIPMVSKIREERNDIEIWDSFWLMLIIATLLGIEWQMRKNIKLV